MLTVLVGYKFIAIGDLYSDTKSEGHLASLLKKSEEYVQVFHRESFEFLKLTLEQESWSSLKLPSNFSIKDIKELKLLTQASSSYSSNSSGVSVGGLLSPSSSSGSSSNGSGGSSPNASPAGIPLSLSLQLYIYVLYLFECLVSF